MDIWKNRNWTPMLLKQIPKPFDSKDYIYELKFDGIRALIFVNKENILIQSRGKKDITNLFKELEPIKKMVNKNIIFDGEIVSFSNGKPQFNLVSKRLHLKNNLAINKEILENPVTFIAFDILYENKDLTNLELLERKNILNKYQDTDFFIKSKVIEDVGIKFFKEVKRKNLEGIVAKLKTGKYHINKRTDDFIKIKNINSDEFIIGGYEFKKDDNISLVLGEYKDNKLYFVGKAILNKKHKMYNYILKMKLSKNYFINYNENINFIKPKLLCHVKYLERTQNNHLRQPIIKEIYEE